MVGFTALVVVLGFFICSFSLQKGVERVSKYMMLALLAIMVILAIHSSTMDGAREGLSFYLKPDLEKMREVGIGNVIVGAMTQAFFTLSLGIGAMAIFGSYIGKERRLFGEAINVGVLDTCVAFVSGLIIFPSAFAFGVNPGQGPSLIFVTLPNVFNAMPGGQLWGMLFFVFMSFAALTTIIAVLENIVAYGIDVLKWTRKKAVTVNFVLVFLLSLPCALGFHVLSGIQPFGPGSMILDLEDFIVSNNLLPLGSMVFLFFCWSAGRGLNPLKKLTTLAGTSMFIMSILYIIMMVAAPIINPGGGFQSLDCSWENIIPQFNVKYFTSLGILVFAVGGRAVNAANKANLGAANIAQNKLPKLHYIAMGLPVQSDEGYGQYGYGGWLIFSTSFDDPQARDEALRQEVVDRAYTLAHHPAQLLSTLSRKNLSTFGRGTFNLNEIFEADAHEADNAVKQAVFENGRFNRAYTHLATAMFVAQMALACIACIQAIRRRDTPPAPLFLTVPGAFLFLSLWGTRARYFFQFMMILLCAGAMFETPSMHAAQKA